MPWRKSRTMSEEKWRAILSPLAWTLYRDEIRGQADDATVRIEELARERRTSKTAVRRALAELEEHGFVTCYVDE